MVAPSCFEDSHGWRAALWFSELRASGSALTSLSVVTGPAPARCEDAWPNSSGKTNSRYACKSTLDFRTDEVSSSFSAFCTDNKTKGDKGVTADVHDEYDDLRLSMSSDFELDRKDLLIVKDGTVRVAESLDREQQQLDANGEVVKASGTWTKAEHERFLHAMETYPKGPWKAIAEIVATRTVRQTQTHAQKYREKMARRMRGLRNRNGTLQTPPMSVGMGIMGYPGGTVSHYSNVHQRIYHHSPHTGALGYTSMPTPVAVVMTNHMVTAPLTTMGTNTGLSSTTSVSAHHSPQQQRLQYISDAMSSSNVVPSAAFSQLSTSTISNAFIGNSAYPSSWEANAAEGKATVPDFDESMDFLMKMYSTNPNQINSTPAPSTLVTPTACIPRTPRTPLSVQNKIQKRHTGQEFTRNRS
ncbi:hypothetical protein BBJ29_009454 [Phytophthora kernoviae]|uniref:Uncharacterized protein n=1 Tax=Phytophthora kernoviae TaxID=325452 RepID=A0A3F2RI56_9STRA|nr:hypothetical protein BBJ29_009454 [Phytophthora kernoviae]RLN57621.1 hypothetical protein BBP00_00007407 [Phytophthora kernoviae]